MKMPVNFHHIFIYLLVIPVLISCTREVDNIDLPDSTPKLVIGAFISPQDTVLIVTVTKSHPIGHISNGNYMVEDAVVTLSDGNTNATLTYDATNKRYSAPAAALPILPGMTYFLNVSTPEGISANAHCTIPSALNNTIVVDVDSSASQYNGYITYNIRINWTDIPGQENYYRIDATLYTTNTFWGYSSYHNFFYDYDTDYLFSDKHKDGQKIVSSKKDLDYYVYSGDDSKHIIASLLTIDKNYYEYYRTRSTFSEDPFAEPVRIYSNIEGGLGVFAGYQTDTVKVVLK